MSQRYNDNTKRPKPQDTQLGISKIYAFCRKIQQRASDPRESAAGVMSVYENTPEKLPHFYLTVQGRVQLEYSSPIIKVIVEVTCQHFKP